MTADINWQNAHIFDDKAITIMVKMDWTFVMFILTIDINDKSYLHVQNLVDLNSIVSRGII